MFVQRVKRYGRQVRSFTSTDHSLRLNEMCEKERGEVVVVVEKRVSDDDVHNEQGSWAEQRRFQLRRSKIDRNGFFKTH